MPTWGRGRSPELGLTRHVRSFALVDGTAPGDLTAALAGTPRVTVTA